MAARTFNDPPFGVDEHALAGARAATARAEPGEQVVLLGVDGRPVGTAEKSEVHTASTPLHLAFSCHILSADGQVLVTRRALGKRTWPGVWTNSVCGHPAPGETFGEAVARRAEHELGLEISDVVVALPDFRYRATDASGVVENELCPVFTARTAGTPRANREEVMDLAWVEPQDLARAVTAAPWALSPWLSAHAPDLPLLRPGARP